MTVSAAADSGLRGARTRRRPSLPRTHVAMSALAAAARPTAPCPLSSLPATLITPTVGAFVAADGWLAAVPLEPSTWAGAPFRVTTPRARASLAVRVTATGRTLRDTPRGLAVRCAITVVGDGEPDETLPGWLYPAG